MEKELHIFILWARARNRETEILDDINKKFNLYEVIEVTWSKKKFAENLSRFYGVKLGRNSSKEKECGNEKFLLITLFDENPKYDWVKTSRGLEYVNINTFEAKQLYRSWTGGGHKVHATNLPAETEHDLVLLLGQTTKDYLWPTSTKQYNGTINKHDCDLVGANGWGSLEEFFYVLNATIKYIVLRNYEYLSHNYVSEEHGDIDLLVGDLENAVLTANAKKVFKPKHRVHYFVKINGKKIFFDFRYKGDEYYCYVWEHDLLKNRERYNSLFYVPSKEDHFYSLIYHAIIHKQIIATDYHIILKKMSEELFSKEIIGGEVYVNRIDLYATLLKKFMRKNGYFFTRPKDKSVFYEEIIINAERPISWLKEHLNVARLRHSCIKKRNALGFFKFTGMDEKSGNPVFIKWGGPESSVEKEYICLKKMNKAYKRFFPSPLYVEKDSEGKAVVLEFIKGRSLEEIFRKNLLETYDTKKILTQLLEIAKILQEEEIIHRDIKPDNIIVKNNNDIFLVDFQFALSNKDARLCESRLFVDRPDIIRLLGSDYRKGNFLWDDAYSFCQIVKRIKKTKKNNELHDKVTRSLNGMEGELYVVGKMKSYIKMTLSLLPLILFFVWQRRFHVRLFSWGLKRRLLIRFCRNL